MKLLQGAGASHEKIDSCCTVDRFLEAFQRITSKYSESLRIPVVGLGRTIGRKRMILGVFGSQRGERNHARVL
ncbi:MAG: hypothetical protein NW226_03890 [Microscillaceae bacterium]|nr:hypothetical protein [Microscillaceae bacterium]